MSSGELALPWEAELPYANFSMRLRRVGSLRAALAAAVPRLAELRRALQPAPQHVGKTVLNWLAHP